MHCFYSAALHAHVLVLYCTNIFFECILHIHFTSAVLINQMPHPMFSQMAISACKRAANSQRLACPKITLTVYMYTVLQATTILAWALSVLAAVAMLSKVVLGVTVVTTTATLPMEETSTQATSVVTVALLQATTATVAMEELLLAVSTALICVLYVLAGFATHMYT